MDGKEGRREGTGRKEGKVGRKRGKGEEGGYEGIGREGGKVSKEKGREQKQEVMERARKEGRK